MARVQAEIIYNPMSGRPGRRAQDAERMVRALARLGIETRAHPTASPGHATELAREAASQGAGVIVSYGGDGTINEVLQAVVGSNTALAVWPGGTANVVARDLAMPASVEQLARIIAAGKLKRVAVGLAHKQGEQGRYFLMFAGIGLDASVARNVNAGLKRHTGQLAFWFEGIKHIATWEPEPFTVEVNGQEYEGVFALIGNGKGYGGGLRIVPEARLEEPLFHIYIVPRRWNNVAYIGDLIACVRGTTALTSATIVKGSRVVANSACEPWVELDGEVVAPLPMQFDAVPDALSLIVP
jgi:YegS/Rv2252/BmrU family lipid kinase